MARTLGQMNLKKLLINWITLQESIEPHVKTLEELRKKQDKIAQHLIAQLGKNHNFLVDVDGKKWLVQVLSKTVHIVPMEQLQVMDGDTVMDADPQHLDIEQLEKMSKLVQ